ncbi:MAG: PQQ-dependent dehydrogenase, methanol/ethanol family [Cycloclasticus sp.]
MKKIVFFLMATFLVACSDDKAATEVASSQVNEAAIVVPEKEVLAENSVEPVTEADVSVPFYGVAQNLQRFAEVTQINDKNVHSLKPAWVLSMGDNRGQSTQPIVIDGIMYATNHNSTFAIDAKTGRQLWKSMIEYPADTVTCCGITNRGVTYHDGVLYRATLDNHVLAMDPKNGTIIWNEVAADVKEGFSMTSAPLVANGVLITGMSGGEFGVRAFIDGRDPKTGELLWRFYTIPEPGEPGGDTWEGDDWKRGGGPTWLIGSYDKDLDLVYWGVGNAAPWNAAMHPGDNLYTNSIIAIRPTTGELVWHYQFTPNDPFDYDGVNDPMLIDIDIDGKPRKVLIQANRNGYFYVIDRVSGELLKANQYVDKLNWADGIDMETGRPIRAERVKNMIATGEQTEIWPSAFGGKNVAPMSFSPETGLAYANTFNIGWKYTPVQQEYKPGIFYIGMTFEWLLPDEPKGYLKAIEPTTGKTVWQFPSTIPMNGGTLVTKGNLVFSGAQTGELYAFNAKTGEKLWEFRTSSGIIAPPITYQLDGKQYIAVVSGIGGVYNAFSGDPKLKNVNAGGSIWVFDLGEGSNSTVAAETILPPVIKSAKADVVDDETTWSASVKHGAELYEQTCSHCHGVKMKTSGTTYDLRTFPEGQKERFMNSVSNGKGQMPAWGEKLSQEEISDLYDYVVH